MAEDTEVGSIGGDCGDETVKRSPPTSKNSNGATDYQESFLLAETSMEMVLEIPFLALSNADIQFAEKELTWRSYTAAEALPTTKRVELIDKKEFAKQHWMRSLKLSWCT